MRGVLAEAETPDARAALVDTNGDGRELWFGLEAQSPFGEWVAVLDWDDVGQHHPRERALRPRCHFRHRSETPTPVGCVSFAPRQRRCWHATSSTSNRQSRSSNRMLISDSAIYGRSLPIRAALQHAAPHRRSNSAHHDPSEPVTKTDPKTSSGDRFWMPHQRIPTCRMTADKRPRPSIGTPTPTPDDPAGGHGGWWAS